MEMASTSATVWAASRFLSSTDSEGFSFILLAQWCYGEFFDSIIALGIGSGYLVTLLLTLGFTTMTVFLGTHLKAPLTAIALSLITGQSWNLTIPLVLVAGLSYVIRKRWEKKR